MKTLSPLLCGLLCVLFLASGCKPNDKPEQKKDWIQISQGSNEIHQGGPIFFILNNKIYMGVGGNSNGAINNFVVYDFQSNVWSQGPTAPNSNFTGSKGLSYTLNNKAYVGTGFPPGIGNGSSYFWEYDPAQSGTAAWTRKADYPTPIYAGISFVLNNQPYVGMGAEKYGAYDNTPFIRLYNYSSSNTWVNSINTGVTGDTRFFSVFVINNIAYFGGGASNATDFYKLNPSNNTVQKLTNGLPNVLNSNDIYGNNTFVVNDKGYVVDFSRNTIYVFDPSAGTWSTISTTLPSTGERYAFTYNNKGYIIDVSGRIYEYIP